MLATSQCELASQALQTKEARIDALVREVTELKQGAVERPNGDANDVLQLRTKLSQSIRGFKKAKSICEALNTKNQALAAANKQMEEELGLLKVSEPNMFFVLVRSFVLAALFVFSSIILAVSSTFLSFIHSYNCF